MAEKSKKSVFSFNLSELLVVVVIIVCLLWGADQWLKNTPPRSPFDMICRTNLKGLGIAFSVYADDHDGNLPSANWCDLSLEEMDIDPKTFNCRAEERVIGESSYAMNINAVGKKLSELPPEMVLLFETNFGKGNEERQPIKTCRSLDKYKIMASCFTGDEEVYPERWNQVGGSEILEIKKHHKTDNIDGCNVLFVSGVAKFIKPEEVKNLKW
jgi:hypothetical protein